MCDTITIRIEPYGIEGTVESNQTISEVAEQLDKPLDLPCGGMGKCGKCRVKVLSGNLAEPTESELAHLRPSEIEQGVRLACQTRVCGDATIVIPPQGQTIGGKEVASDLLRDAELQANVRLIKAALPEADLEDQRSDLQRVIEGLAGDVEDMRPHPGVLPLLSESLRQGQFEITATVVGNRLVDVHAGSETPRVLGAAVDIGTTTVGVYILDLLTGQQVAAASGSNSQAQHGADVISRIQYCNETAEGLARMRGLVCETINAAIAKALDRVGGAARDIYEVTVVGNTTMLHLFMGLQPRYIAEAPYIPVTTLAQSLEADRSGISMHPRGSVFCLPAIAAYVGADTVGVIVAAGIVEYDEPVLAVDIGTNGEIVLWSGDELYTASTAAGPAFEGAQIEYGMHATAGAIDYVGINDCDIEIGTIGDVEATGICGSGLFDAMATALRLGVVDKTGRLVDGNGSGDLPEAIARRLLGEGNERRLLLSHTGASRDVYLSQRDIRELQLAKGAVRAGVEMLLQWADMSADELEHVLLAGAFGNYIDPESALRIGLLPDIRSERIEAIGNAAGAGAILALMSNPMRDRCTEIVETATHIELSQRAEFQTAFTDSMMFP